MATKVIILLLLVCGAFAEFTFREYKETTLGRPVDAASVKLLKEAVAAAGGKNVVSSPLGVLILLSLYSAGTTGALRDDIANAIGGSPSNYTEVTDLYSQLSRNLEFLDKSYFTLANKIYVSINNKLQPEFSAVARNYNTEVDRLDFSNAQLAAATINKWSDEKTRGLIKDPVSPDAITPDIAAALFNVIYFQGHWHVPFKVEDTEEKDFYISKSDTVKKPMMKLQQSLFFYDSSSTLGAKLVELPYKESGFRMVIVLPNEIDGLPSVLEKVAQNGLLNDINQLGIPNAEVDLLLPKFEITSDLDLNEILPKLGLSKLFNVGAPGIVDGPPVVVSKAFQKAFIKVDEEGATAGAFTGFIAVPVSDPSPPVSVIEFHVDHPFLYAILHDDTVLFIGIYQN